MKKLFTLLAMFLLSVCLFAQAPQKFTYQAVVRDGNNKLLVNAPVGVRVSILQGGETGTAVYEETHASTTNANGLMTFQIGDGNVTNGSFDAVDWANGPFFVKIETDPAGGNNYLLNSVQQLLSVPYAQYANQAGNAFSGKYEDLTGSPTQVSVFENDANYVNNSECPTANFCDLYNVITNMQNTISELQNTVSALDSIINANQPGGSFKCGKSKVKDHEGNEYNTVQIGEQCWTRENMRAKTSPSTGTNIMETAPGEYSFTGKKAYYPDGSASNVEEFGLLYNWNAAVDTFNTAFGETSTDNADKNNAVSAVFSGNRRGICPEGWHIPSDSDYIALIEYVGSQSENACGGIYTNIAKALASTTGWDTCTSDCTIGKDLAANNNTGFSAVPAGIRSTETYVSLGSVAYFWTVNEHSNYRSYFRFMSSDNANLNRKYDRKYYGYSVRCLKD